MSLWWWREPSAERCSRGERPSGTLQAPSWNLRLGKVTLLTAETKRHVSQTFRSFQVDWSEEKLYSEFNGLQLRLAHSTQVVTNIIRLYRMQPSFYRVPSSQSPFSFLIDPKRISECRVDEKSSIRKESMERYIEATPRACEFSEGREAKEMKRKE